MESFNISKKLTFFYRKIFAKTHKKTTGKPLVGPLIDFLGSVNSANTWYMQHYVFSLFLAISFYYQYTLQTIVLYQIFLHHLVRKTQ